MAAVDTLGAAPKRPGGGKKWSEVCERVQQPDGSVRTSAPFKPGPTGGYAGAAAGSAAASAVSPPRPRPAGVGGPVGSGKLGIGKLGASVGVGPVAVGGVGSGVGVGGGTLCVGSAHGSGAGSSSLITCSSRGGSSRGSLSGVSSRSSSRDGYLARDGDISSRCSSGGWDTSTNSSEGHSRPRTPTDVAPSPSGSKALLMPDPIRTNLLMLPPALLDDEQTVSASGDAGKLSLSEKENLATRPGESGERMQHPHPVRGPVVGGEGSPCTGGAPGGPPGGLHQPEAWRDAVVPAALTAVDGASSAVAAVARAGSTPASMAAPSDISGGDAGGPAGGSEVATGSGSTTAATPEPPQRHPDPRPGLPLRWDPYGRDVPRGNTLAQNVWSVDSLAKYLRNVIVQIDLNLQNRCVPSADKLDAFVQRLVANVHRQIKHAPKKVKHTLNNICAKRFQKFWNFARNEKARTTTPEELRTTLNSLVEALLAEFSVNPDARPVTAQPKPVRHHSIRMQRPNLSVETTGL
eukprot:gnl/TRDRNA2_/TRDRNA2_39144_c0_seq1.p1 gnl/TRDRNA2_/TRDRNA2_39144_c0~~gnl/TRDRNA2_/TRDRNA2_39144_c0_seq1.p1  ORF type:complete len:520 (-),score=82.64 gnl/TRDRNA2_/TRDRNA2_39144_c0_seq1:40-1599(-)